MERHRNSAANHITDQSNLLALNAALEAARAGEVRSLAEQSRQVGAILGEIQKAANTAVAVLHYKPLAGISRPRRSVHARYC